MAKRRYVGVYNITMTSRITCVYREQWYVIITFDLTYAAFQSPRANGAHDFPSCANRSIHVSHLHLWRSGDGFSDSVCTAGKKMASLHRKPYIIALQLQLCTWREPSYSRITHALVGKRAQEVWEKKRKKGKIIIIINKKLTGKINMKKSGKK